MKTFNPNSITFEDGLKRIGVAAKRAGLKVDEQIITSRDEAVMKLTKTLQVRNVPQGFEKWQLPISVERGQFFMTSAAPHAESPEHSHDEGAGVRFIISGSISYRGKELTAGDWMYIPKGARYSFKVGAFGALMGYCYSCCCAGKLDLESVINPAVNPAPVVHG